MAAVDASHLDLECGGGSGGGGDDSDSSSVCFSDAEEGSCCSQFYSTAGDGSHDGDEEEEVEITESRRASSVAESDCSVAVGDRVLQNKSCVVKVERDCRICHLSLDSSGPESGVAIELGCSCKNDLAASHKHCAEEWFRIKGNRVCEICNSIAQNVVVVVDIRPLHHINEITMSEEDTDPEPEPVPRTRRACPDGRFLNFVLALMVFAFVLSWLFHFNVHS